MKRKHKRLSFVVIALALLGAAAGLILMAFEDSIVFFYSPTDLATKHVQPGQRLRLGGLVEEKSVVKKGDGVTQFTVTDTAHSVKVSYKGILPDLFREGQGVVTEGRFDGSTFQAEEVLAKHDENYMPPEVAAGGKAAGGKPAMPEAKPK